MTKADLYKEFHYEMAQIDRELDDGEITLEQHMRYEDNLRANLESELEDFDNET